MELQGGVFAPEMQKGGAEMIRIESDDTNVRAQFSGDIRGLIEEMSHAVYSIGEQFGAVSGKPTEEVCGILFAALLERVNSLLAEKSRR